MNPRIFDTLIDCVVIIIKAIFELITSILNGIEYSYRWLFNFKAPSSYWGNVIFSIVGLFYLALVSIGIIIVINLLMRTILKGGKLIENKIKRK